MAEILIVDDEAKIGKLLAAELGDAGHRTTSTTKPLEALALAEKTPPDIIITDLRMDGLDGLTLLKKVKARSPSIDVIVMTAYASVETALETMKHGAYDYIIKPFKTEELLLLVSRIEDKRRLEAENEGLRSYISTNAGDEIVGSSAAINEVKKTIIGLAGSDASVLITGESGTGKELVARAIHATSKRANGPFIALNCAAIPETLIESELFGYEKGAFTGAVRRKAGYFQLAHRGTLFLDEIGDLPHSLQPKLLRVLEDRRITPLGGVRATRVDIRLVTATHRHLEEEIVAGTFRQDLFYRVNVFPIVIPPLRERKSDIREIAARFLEEWGRPAEDLGDGAIERLVAYDWPGNVRELRNVLERATIIRPSGTISHGDILLGDSPKLSRSASVTTLNLAEAEREIILRALDASGGNKSEAARLLGITRRALYGRLERYDIE